MSDTGSGSGERAGRVRPFPFPHGFRNLAQYPATANRPRLLALELTEVAGTVYWTRAEVEAARDSLNNILDTWDN